MTTLIRITICLFASNGHLTYAMPNNHPETMIEVSIADLIPKKKKEPHLSSKYAEQIINLIESTKPQMLECLDLGGVMTMNFIAKLSISARGAVRSVQNQKASRIDIADCISRTLAGIRFPPHPLQSDVTVTLPIALDQETL